MDVVQEGPSYFAGSNWLDAVNCAKRKNRKRCSAAVETKLEDRKKATQDFEVAKELQDWGHRESSAAAPQTEPTIGWDRCSPRERMISGLEVARQIPRSRDTSCPFLSLRKIRPSSPVLSLLVSLAVVELVRHCLLIQQTTSIAAVRLVRPIGRLFCPCPAYLAIGSSNLIPPSRLGPLPVLPSRSHFSSLSSCLYARLQSYCLSSSCFWYPFLLHRCLLSLVKIRSPP